MNKLQRFISSMLVIVLVMGAISILPVVAQDDEVTIRYYVPQWASSSDRRAERQIAFQSVLDTFALKYPNITLEEVVFDGSQVTSTQEIVNGNADAIWINNFWYAEWQKAGYFADLTPYMEEGVEESYFDWTIDALRSPNCELGGLWHNTDTPLFFYRSDIIETPPATWSELRAMAEAYSAENPGQYLFTAPLANFTQLTLGMFEAAGGTLIDADGAPVLFEDGNREIWTELFGFYVDMVADGLMPAEAAVNNHGGQMPLVYAGDVVSFIGNSNMHIRALQPNLPPDEYELWASAPIPRPDSAEAGLYVAGGWVIALVANDDPAIQLERFDPDQIEKRIQSSLPKRYLIKQAMKTNSTSWNYKP